jgi:hypothetical protein
MSSSHSFPPRSAPHRLANEKPMKKRNTLRPRREGEMLEEFRTAEETHVFPCHLRRRLAASKPSDVCYVADSGSKFRAFAVCDPL